MSNSSSSRTSRQGSAGRYRLAVLSRVLAATLGAYALAAATAAFLARVVPGPRIEAAMVATLLAFVVLCAAVIWVFAARNAWWAWAGVALPAGAISLVACCLARGATP